MGEVIKFPDQPARRTSSVGNEEGELLSARMLKFRKLDALSSGTPLACFNALSSNIGVGLPILIIIGSKKYNAVVTDILSHDENGNVTKIGYTVPFLSGDDPNKFGVADFIYKIETYE